MGSKKVPPVRNALTIACTEVNSEDFTKEELAKLAKECGVISCKVVPFAEVDDETLAGIYEYSGPGWIIEHRPDWIKRFHPEHIN